MKVQIVDTDKLAQAKNSKKISVDVEKSSLEAVVNVLYKALIAKDRDTAGHSRRVAEYARKIAEMHGMSDAEQQEIYSAGLLHDIGKIRVMDSMINKKSQLTNEEHAFMKLHSIAGYLILKDIPSINILSAAKWHHERYDGNGYPDGLSGENIPEIARIIAVADCYDAMTSERSYRNIMPQAEAREQIALGRGTQFDPAFADIMLQMIDDDTQYAMKQVADAKKNVLIIDNEETTRIKLTEMLGSEEYEVFTAENGLKGVDIILSEHIDVILLAINMKEMSGFEVLEIIQPLTDARIIFCTADKNIESIKRAAAAGIRDYITKPFFKDTLIEMLKS